MHISPIETAANAQVAPMDADLHTYGFPPGYFVIRNVASNRLLDVRGDMIEDGTPVILYPETETSIVEDMRNPESNNQVSTLCTSLSAVMVGQWADISVQVFFIDTYGALCSRSSGHAIDAENDGLVLRHRRPVSHPFPNAYSHPLPRFSFERETGRIAVTFASDPSYPSSPDRATALSSWKSKTFVLTSIPMRKPRTIVDDASELITSAITMPFTLFGVGGSPPKASPEEVFSSGDIDLTEDEILETERTDEGEVDDSFEKMRQVKVVAFSKKEERVTGEKSKARRRWECIPLRITRNRTSGVGTRV